MAVETDRSNGEKPTQGASVVERVQSGPVVLLLYLAYLLSFADRSIFSITLKPIKMAFHLSDTALGLLSGSAFALSLALFSPVGGWIVDRANRRPIFAGAVTFWSVATFFTGLAQTVGALTLSRIGVGIGESLVHPLAVSLVADTVPRPRRAQVFATYISASALGLIAASFFGGLWVRQLSHAHPVIVPGLPVLTAWRMLFVSAAIPGLILALAILVFLREPVRTEAAAEAGPSGRGAAIDFVRRYPRLFVTLFFGLAIMQMSSQAIANWNVVFFGRVFGLSPGEAALTNGTAIGVCILIGCLLAGRIIGALRTRGYADAPLRVAIGAALFFMVVVSCALVIPDRLLCIVVESLAFLGATVPTVCAFVALGEVLPSGARATFTGLHALSSGIITSSVGPFLIGFLNDRFFGVEAGIRYSMITTVVAAVVIGAMLTLLGLGDYRRRMAELADAAG